MEANPDMSTYAFNPQAKIFYRPIDAALRWCCLIRYESEIVQAAGSCPDRLKTLFPQWPCLQANTEKIYDAIRNGELPYGSLGISLPLGTPVDPTLLTVRHSDLRHWMQIYYPDQRPDFLFESGDESQGQVSLGVHLSLQAERDALLRERNTLRQQLQNVETDLQALGLEQESLKALASTQGELSNRSEHTYLQIIGAMLSVILDKSPAGKPFSVFESQAAFVDILTAYYADYPGLRKRTLDKKFAAANRSLKKAL